MAIAGEFDEVYRLEHTQHFTPERTRLEVDALVRALGVTPSERVLDLGCGWGRHLGELRQRGFSNLVGVDVQGAFLEPLEGAEMLERDVTGLEVEADFDTKFDAVYCAFNALFSHADAAQKVFQTVSKALKPGGRFLLDTQNREPLARIENLVRSWRGGGELPWLLEESRFDLLKGVQTIVQKRIFTDGHTEERTLTRYHYTLTELAKLARAAGLALTAVYGDWQLGPYTVQSSRMMLTLAKA